MGQRGVLQRRTLARFGQVLVFHKTTAAGVDEAVNVVAAVAARLHTTR
ncbi:MAG: hypothetical protein ABI573_05280 [Chloroflexota bacterium]